MLIVDQTHFKIFCQNEEFPGVVRTGTLCSHIVKVSAGVCFVKVDLHQFYLSGGSQDKCDMDWFSVIGAYGGHQEDMKTKLLKSNIESQELKFLFHIS